MPESEESVGRRGQEKGNPCLHSDTQPHSRFSLKCRQNLQSFVSLFCALFDRKVNKMDGQRSGVKPTSTTLGFDYLMTSLARLELNGDVSKEYSKLPPPHSFPCQVGKTEKVAKKNRFKDIVPYDHNRVILCPQSSTLIDDMDENADYINASFIR
ncbi:Tyrosine-protein phosphatase 69D, partial [Bulinus truncatus]